MCVEIQPRNAEPYLVSPWYRTLTYTVGTFDKFEEVLQGKDVLIIGDRNCDFTLLQKEERDSNAPVRNNINVLMSYTFLISLCSFPTVPVELKLPIELNSFSDASGVCEPANESLFFVTCRFRKNTELFSLINKQSIVLRSTSCGS